MIYLGSKSPRRHELLKSILTDFNIIHKDVDETFDGIADVHLVANYLSEKKYKSIITGLKKEDWLITADTIVVKDQMILNKPEDQTEAVRMLTLLNGGYHEVLTGVTLGNQENFTSFTDTTLVFIEKMTGEEIEYYIENYKPYDKAGSYGIQDWIGIAKISRIEGSYTNVMGLPTQKLYSILKEKGLLL